MVEAAGVEPVQDVENTQVVDSRNGHNGKKGQKGKSTVQNCFSMTVQSPDVAPTQVSSLGCSSLKLIF
jgi:hypothetical protein